MKLPIISPVSKLTDRVIRILGCNPGVATLQGTNTYVLGAGEHRTIIDTGDGLSDEYIEHLSNTMKGMNFQINRIIITHWHKDHIGGINRIKKLVGVDLQTFKYPDPHNERRYDFDFIPLLNDQVMRIEDFGEIKIHYTPGHADDEIAIQDLVENSIFCGDTLLGHGTTLVQDLVSYLKSLDLLKSLNPSVMYPGHGEHITNPLSLIDYYISRRLQRENEILQILRDSYGKEITALDIVEKIYPNKNVHRLALMSISSHLGKLELENRIESIFKNDQRYIKLIC